MWNSERRKILILAYFDCYVFPLITVFLPLFIGTTDKSRLLYLSIFILVFSVYKIIGFRLEWKHVYCSYQRSTRQKMTPDDIRFENLSFLEKYALFIILIVVSVISFIVLIFD